MACIILGALFAAVDEAVTAFGEPRARAAREAGGPYAATAARYLNRTLHIQLRYLTGRVLCLVIAAVVAYDVAIGFRSVWAQFATVGATSLVYAVAIGISTTLARRRAGGLALPALRYCRPLEYVVAPFAAPLVWASLLMDTLFPPRPEDDPERVTEIVVEQLIERGEELGSITEQNAELLKSVIEFGDTVAREIMVPRTSMVAVEIDTPLPDVVRLIVEKGHSRYPVYREKIDQLVGILYAKDLFRLLREGMSWDGRLEDLIRNGVFFAAESQKISDLLRLMQSRRVHLAVVVDEFGGTSGMISLEDIIEEIVGEIRDEHDVEEAPVRSIGSGRFIADADVSVHDLADSIGLELPAGAGTYESLGGMLIDLAGHVPANGDTISIGRHDFIVRGADERHVTHVEVVERDSVTAAE